MCSTADLPLFRLVQRLPHKEARQIIKNAKKLGIKLDLNEAGLQGFNFAVGVTQTVYSGNGLQRRSDQFSE